jgi:hypothetical protein
MTWNNFRKPVKYKNRIFGTKEMEFGKIELLPERNPHLKLELAIGGSGAPIKHWEEIGWHIIDSQAVSLTANDYRNYIQNSRGELSVAKNLYVATQSGWFSCRSACYLASARPVVIQDTGFSEFIPTGCGVFAFRDLQEAEDALQDVEENYERHQASAREIANEYFEARVVLRQLLEDAGVY